MTRGIIRGIWAFVCFYFDLIFIKLLFRFQKEDNLIKIKCFKKDDPPNAPGLSVEEFIEYQNKLIEQHLERNVPMEELKT